MAPETKAAEVAAPVHDKAQYLALLRHNTQLLQRSVAHVEQRYTARVVRSLPYMRRHAQAWADVLALLVNETLTGAHREELLAYLPPPYKPESAAEETQPEAMDEDASAAPAADEAFPEVLAYVRLLVVVYLLSQPSSLAPVSYTHLRAHET